jgi:putative nucleotidyltransferase with HDIG domain
MSRCASVALVQAQDEPALLQATCNVITDIGYYRAAWIGLCGPGEDQLIPPAAWSGAGACPFRRCAAAPTTFWWGSGLVDTEMRSGRPCIAPLEIQHANLEPWRQVALKQGFRLAASFPLTVRGLPLGCMTILAESAVGFDAMEMDLLGQIANGLAYGLAALREREAGTASVMKLQQSIEATVEAIATMLDERDPYTADHQRRTAEIAMAIARELGTAEADVHGIRLASLIHDVGKVAIPAEILNRPGRLTLAQFEIVKAHAQAGFDIVRGIAFPWPVAQTILQHHERLDGTGYPNGLRDDAILPDARIVAVADVVDAICSFRPYRPSLGTPRAVQEIVAAKGRHFDPDVVDACVRLLRNGAFEVDGDTSWRQTQPMT